MVMTVLLGVWQIHIVSDTPILVIRDLIATLYRKGVDAGSCALSDLPIVAGNLTAGFALFATTLIGTALGAVGLFRDLETAMPLSLSPQRLILRMSGLWFAGTAISICYLEF